MEFLPLARIRRIGVPACVPFASAPLTVFDRGSTELCEEASRRKRAHPSRIRAITLNCVCSDRSAVSELLENLVEGLFQATPATGEVQLLFVSSCRPLTGINLAAVGKRDESRQTIFFAIRFLGFAARFSSPCFSSSVRGTGGNSSSAPRCDVSSASLIRPRTSMNRRFSNRFLYHESVASTRCVCVPTKFFAFDAPGDPFSQSGIDQQVGVDRLRDCCAAVRFSGASCRFPIAGSHRRAC